MLYLHLQATATNDATCDDDGAESSHAEQTTMKRRHPSTLPTGFDIARIVGVSQSTVSLVMSARPRAGFRPKHASNSPRAQSGAITPRDRAVAALGRAFSIALSLPTSSTAVRLGAAWRRACRAPEALHGHAARHD